VSHSRYLIPACTHRVGETIQRSRFITTLSHAPESAVAHEFVKQIKDECPDATHNSWAFAAGPPGSTSEVGLSDDGEPHNTAGKPMLNALLHRRLLKEYSGSRTWRLCAFRQGTTTRRSRATPRRRDAGSTAQPPCAHDHEGNDHTR